LGDVLKHYNAHCNLELHEEETNDLVAGNSVSQRGGRPMRTHFLTALAGMLGLALALTGRAAAQPSAEPPPNPEGVQVLARGPVHEAFAEPGQARPLPTSLVSKQPPEPINEEPPGQKPEGDSVVWMPGYWAWDTDRDDFLWVSGCWRNPPPGRQWVPGAWQQVEGGWHWVAGFWAVAGQDQLQYLPAPPPSVDEGPSMPAPEAGGTYAPGCWMYRGSRFLWRPGFWVAYHPGWIWTPSHYVWTPVGYLFVEGFWDMPLDDRGLLFAPAQIDPALLAGSDWTYVPQYAVQSDFLLSALFVQPANCHYYFGDYFDGRSQEAGFIPWVDYRVSRGSYDANFAYYHQSFAGQQGWEKNLRELYAARLSGTVPRPPHSLGQQNQLIRNLTANKTGAVMVHKGINLTHMQNLSVLAPLAQIHNARVTNLAGLGNAGGVGARPPGGVPRVMKLQQMPRPQVVQEQRAAQQFQAVARQRRQAETRILAQGALATRPAGAAPQQVRIDLARRPLAAAGVPVRVAPQVVPPHPQLPPHENRPIPSHQPPRWPAPPRR
jgi:hypothetical protein